jgi:hypothetical protein
MCIVRVSILALDTLPGGDVVGHGDSVDKRCLNTRLALRHLWLQVSDITPVRKMSTALIVLLKAELQQGAEHF